MVRKREQADFMKVLLLLDSFHEDNKGEILFRLCQRWHPLRELTVSTIAFGEGGPLANRFRSAGISAQVIPHTRLRDHKLIREEGKRILNRSDRPDVICSHCRWPDLTARFFHQGNPSIPFLSTIYSLDDIHQRGWAIRTWRNLIEQFTRKNISAFVFTSNIVQEQFAFLQSNKTKQELISPGVDAIQCFPLAIPQRLHYRKTLGVTPHCPLLISAAPLEPSKGHLDLIEAMPAVLKELPETRLFIIGDGKLRPELEQTIRKMGLKQSIRIIGHLDKLLPKLFSAADLVVHPSLQESFSLSVAQAMATATPVIATEVGELPEMIKDGVTGRLVPPSNPSAISRAIIDTLSDEEQYSAMCYAARDRIINYFEAGKAAEAYIMLWRRLAPQALWQNTDNFPSLPDQPVGKTFDSTSKENIIISKEN
jgi:glycosyltransferase involved in cell wall biosynthesis